MGNQVVLLVEGDEQHRALGAQRLRAASYYVETAASATEALELAKQIVPDAILCDVALHDLDGYALCRLLRNEPALAAIAIVILGAADGELPDHQLAQRVGASALIVRSPDFDAELSALRRCLATAVQPHPAAADAALYAEHLRRNARQIEQLRARAQIAEERYPALLRHAQDTITFLTTDGHVLEANARWTELTGVPVEDIIGRHIRELSPAADVESHAAAYRQGLATGRGAPVPIRKADGSTIYMEFTSTVTVYEGSTTVLAIGRDVTEQLATAARLAAAEAQYRSLIERMPDVIWTSTIDGQLTYVTPNVERVTGESVELCLRDTLAGRISVIHPSHRAAVAAGFRGYAEAGIPFDLEYQRVLPDGRWIWLRNRAMATYERDGVRYMEGILTDITERKRLEVGLQQAQKMEALGQLTGGIAHDFNNIMATVLASAEFLRQDLHELDPRRADADVIANAAERAAALTRQLLAFSRNQVLEPVSVDLNQALRTVEGMLRRIIGADIAFAVEHAASLAHVRVDVGQLEQVIVNMVVNAREAMPRGGALTLATANVRVSAAAPVLTLPPGAYVTIAVRDTGRGMDPATQAHMFEPFFTTKTVGDGSGLGLSTCYGIVKQSGGDITVHSELGRGSELTIYLPCIDDAPPQVMVPPARSTLDGKETILIIEDDLHVRNAVRRMLKPRGYHLLVADGPQSAEHLLASHDGVIDLVLSDVIMPGQSGPEIVEHVHAHSPEARTLYMSGYTDHPVLRSGVFATGTAFLQKPFGPDALARKVREVLDA